MSDNLSRYRAIKQALKQLYPKEPQGNWARYLNTLAGLISGIVGSKSTNIPLVASKVPDGRKVDSRWGSACLTICSTKASASQYHFDRS
jgi:hypothetical protein